METDVIKAVPEQLHETTQNLQNLLSSVTDLAVNFGLKLLASVLVLAGGMWLAKRLANSFKRLLMRRSLDASLVSFLSSFVNIILRIFVVIISLTTVGVQMTSIVAVLGAASLAVGMALSGTMQNFAGGIIIMFLKPFKVGDVIEVGGKIGTVKKIMIFNTEIHTFDNQVVLLPNGTLANGQITNLSDTNTRRAELSIAISYGDDVDVARREITAIISSDKRVLKNKDIDVFVSDLGDNAVVLTVWYWTKFVDNVPSKGDMLEAIYKRLPKKKIHFPFPQIDVHIQK
ncbi:MAG: mechanosensitive ion channel [Alphaproteobacteria bacterium]|nr:mechanosensitive ion channel [Alphaproteobacteria bacterium]